MVYNFSGFSAQSFERLIQALVAKKFGAATQVFGAGPDGAREAAFEGKLEINPQQIWEGYVVVQAKYQQFPGRPAENAAWLRTQLDEEFKKFEDPSKGLRRPDYYVIASNVRLSAAAANGAGKGGGGIDKLQKYLVEKKNALAMKGVVLWHADVLSALLDAEPDIRTRFSCWVDQGDVLSAALLHLKDKDIETYVPDFLRSQFRKSRDVKTKDAGQTTGKKVVLDDIFIDLPLDQYSLMSESFDFFDDVEAEARAEQTAEQGMEQADFAYPGSDEDYSPDFDGDNRSFVVKKIAERCFDKFDAVGNHECLPRNSLKNSVVLMGGPGQGKSTVSQFLGQIFRARLLQGLPDNQLDLEPAIELVLARAKEEGVPLNGPARFPIVIDLPSYADALNRAVNAHSNMPLLRYIANQIANGMGELTANALRRWLALVPTIFILDGLDEVPHSSNRKEVVDAINQLMDTLSADKVDHFTLVTSRPQGYQNELNSKVWSHWEMADLAPKDALRYGAQLASVLVSDETRRQEIVENLVFASTEEATSPLMTSPLQVSLLFALVETRNNIPKDRWTLFYRYYEILRDREIAKGGDSGKLIGQYKSEIDRLHYEAGYLLHLRGESSGGADPFFSLEEFSSIVAKQLDQSEYDVDSDRLREDIVSLATTRLVFLRAKTDGQIAFEVRSLQEFMAAARLMASPESMIKGRLKEIAGISHWSHVFKIACSKVYSSAELESLREEILAILDSVDAGDVAQEDAVIHSGALLAAEMLADGVPGAVPSSKRNLMVRALRLIDTPYFQGPLLLAKATDQATIKAVERALVQSLRDKEGSARQRAFKLLAFLTHSEDSAVRAWAQGLFLEWAPIVDEDALKIVDSKSLIRSSKLVRDWLRTALWRAPIQVVREWSDAVDEDGSDSSEWCQILGAQDIEKSYAYLLTSDGKSTSVQLGFRRYAQTIEIVRPPESAHLQWHILHRWRQICIQPTTRVLADFIRALSPEQVEAMPLRELPWIVAHMIDRHRQGSSLAAIGDEIEAGLFGEPERWYSTEKRWAETGIFAEELQSVDSNQLRLIPTTFKFYFRRIGEGVPLEEKVENVSTIYQVIANSESAQPFFERILVGYLRRHPGIAVSDSIVTLLQRRAPSITGRPAIVQELAANLGLASSPSQSAILAENVQILTSCLTEIPAASISNKFQIDVILREVRTNRSLLSLLAGPPQLRAKRAAWLDELPVELLEVQSGDTGLVREAIAILRLMLAQDAQIADIRTISPNRLRILLGNTGHSSEYVTDVLKAVCYQRLTATGRGDVHYASALQNVLRDAMRKRMSRFGRPEIYSMLRLPSPV
ncbi:NACHT domain-containing protein [Rhizobium sp. BR 314]|uniref:NACHT domain-containing protein n=1 Tax=Rhizobium sp. BR 314 TaxID=3040013 RepID=UPI0039BF6AA7